MAEQSRLVSGVRVRGVDMDYQTRCRHYHGPLDVIAIRFPCCETYYPCHACHVELADHPARPIPSSEWDRPGVLCGVCGRLLTVRAYLVSGYRCPHCGAAFNPGCVAHYALYFDAAPNADETGNDSSRNV